MWRTRARANWRDVIVGRFKNKLYWKSRSRTRQCSVRLVLGLCKRSQREQQTTRKKSSSCFFFFFFNFVLCFKSCPKRAAVERLFFFSEVQCKKKNGTAKQRCENNSRSPAPFEPRPRLGLSNDPASTRKRSRSLAHNFSLSDSSVVFFLPSSLVSFSPL